MSNVTLMAGALVGLYRRHLVAVGTVALVVAAGLGVLTYALLAQSPRSGHPGPAVTVTEQVPGPAVTVTAGASETASAHPVPTVTVTELVATEPASGGPGWGTSVASIGTGLAGLGALVAGIAAVATLLRRKPKPAPAAEAQGSASP